MTIVVRADPPADRLSPSSRLSAPGRITCKRCPVGFALRAGTGRSSVLVPSSRWGGDLDRGQYSGVDPPDLPQPAASARQPAVAPALRVGGAVVSAATTPARAGLGTAPFVRRGRKADTLHGTWYGTMGSRPADAGATGGFGSLALTRSPGGD